MKKENVVSIFFLAVLFVLISGTSLAKAEWIPVQTELRVGLTALYHGKDSLTINNEKLVYGYCI